MIKKLPFLLLMFAITSFSFAQTVVFSDNFDSYAAGSHLAASNSAWTTWGNAPGGPQDGVISNAQASSAPNSLYITEGNDQVYIPPFSNYITGHYQVSFSMFIPTDKKGYFNALHKFDLTNGSVWAYECFFYADGSGNLIAKDTIEFIFPINTWFPVVMDFDPNQDLAYLSINNTVVHTWPFHYWANGELDTVLQYSRQISAIDFFASSDTVNYYIDDFVVTALSGDFTVSHGGISFFQTPDSSLTRTITLANYANQPTNWQALITYDIASPDTTSTGISKLTYYNNVTSSYVSGVPFEYAVGFPSSMLQNHIGKTIQGIKFSWEPNGIIGVDSTNVLVRVYSMNNPVLMAGPGTVIYEKSLVSTAGANYVPIDTQIVLDGSDLWVGVYWGNTQNRVLTPLVLDTLSSLGLDTLSDGYRCWEKSYWGFQTWFKTREIYPIEVFVDGTPIQPWLSVDSDRGSIDAWGSVEQIITANSNGMQYGDHRSAKIHLYSDSYNNSEKEVVIYLDVTHVGVNDHNEIEVSIYPNPATDRLQVVSDEIQRVEIHNMMGQRVFDQCYGGTHVTIPTSGMAPGTYIVTVTSRNNRVSKQVVIR